jgi:inosose dehydratase
MLCKEDFIMSDKSKFGISLDLVNLLFQEPDRNRYESKYYWDELFTLIPAAGFNCIEIPYLPMLDLSGRIGVPMSLATITAKYGSVDKFLQSLKADGIDDVICVTFDASKFLRGDLDRYFGAVNRFVEPAIQFAAESGAGTLAISPAPCYARIAYQFENKVNDWSAWKQDFASRTAEMINMIAQKAAKSNVVISVKNEYWSLLRDTGFEFFVRQLDPQVKMDIDTAHLAIQGIDVVSKIRELSDRIGSIHLTDTTYFDNAGDWMKDVNPEFPSARATQVFRDIGTGSINLAAAVEALSQTGYDGKYVCSCRQTRDVSRALLRTRRLINKIAANQ